MFAAVSLAPAACAGAGAPQSITPQATMPQAITPLAQQLASQPLNKELRGIYVSDFKANDIVIFSSKTYKQIGTITQGLLSPDGEWIDRHGNLYVANGGAANILEFGPGQTTPKMTYTAGIAGTFRVVTDKHGNVYGVNDNGGHYPNLINVYPQGVNKVKRQYLINGDVSDLTFDGSGNMYVDVDIQGSVNSGYILEYSPGSTQGEQLGVQTGWAFSMVMDRQKNLVLGDRNSGTIDIIPPPYSKIGSQISGFAAPYSLAFNPSATKLYVVDLSAYSLQPIVDVLQYPSGKLITQLGPANGLSYPYGIAVAPERQ